MKLSENTVEILKNFSSINTGLVVKPGNHLRTISSTKAILADAEIDETFDQEFGVYDLNKLLAILSMNKKDPEVSIEKEFLAFNGISGDAKIRMRFTPTNLILTPPAKNINVPSYEVNFALTQTALNWISDVASILKCPNIVVKGDGEKIAIWAMDVKGEIVDDANIIVGESTLVFDAVLKIENLKIISGDYNVELSSVGVSKLTSTSKKVTYWIALEQGSSKFNK